MYLLAGQSNMDGRGLVSELTPEQSQQFDDAIIFYRSVPHSSDGWQRLAPGFSVPPKYTGSLPSPSFGPELAFAREMHDASPRRKLALIKGSKGGTSLRVDWNPGEHGEPDTQGPRYRDFMETIHLATETLAQRGDTFAIRGLLWHQGESDSKASAAVYQERLETLIARIRQDTGVADLPVVVGEVFDNGKRDSVRAAIRAVGTSTSKLGFVSSAGTSTSDEGTHFDAASQWLMGKRFAEAMRKIQAGDNPPPMSNKTEPSQGTRRATGKPNVLFIAIDDLNDWIGCLGGSPDAKTPHLDRLAARSVLFDNAHCQVALCNASRSSVLSGLYASTTNIYGNSSKNASDAYKNAKQMPVWFRDNGYRAACMGKIYHNDHGKKEYWDEIGPKTLRWGPEPPNGRQFTERFGNQAEDSL
ncbi:MAG TPA: sialate O-acetylesterase, partial [Pirellulaceae bacterium]|nr:sialate O-acetylesterase [Pirellulaceae bacterium]